MSGDHADADADDPPCRQCGDPAAFWLSRPDEPAWRALCERHVVHAHPSIELRAWLESGYARPIEVGRPAGPPDEPRHGRAAAFRELVEEVLD